MLRWALLIAVSSLVAGCDEYGGDSAEAPARSAARQAVPAPLERSPQVTPAGLGEHLRGLQDVADENGGNRAAGSAGDRASVAYASARLRQAGWRVRLQDVSFPFFEERAARLTVGGTSLRNGRSFRVLSYSGSGRATGALRRVGSGCGRDDFEGVQPGELPVALRGGCFFRVKARNAELEGAPALLVADADGDRGVPQATLGAPGVEIPVVLVNGRVSLGAGARAGVAVRTRSERRTTQNVIAETPGGSGKRVVMAGAHLDSVSAGPGLNDNGSGVAALLEAAEAVGERPPGARVRLGLWGAEELGLIGSRRYVRSLGRAERRRLAAYLNFDMVGSPNAVLGVYSDGDPALERVLRASLRQRAEGAPAGGRSDHAAFEAAGVPVNGVYTGSAERGPRGGRRDPCYHLACDTIGNVDRATLLTTSLAVARALRRLSAREGRR